MQSDILWKRPATVVDHHWAEAIWPFHWREEWKENGFHGEANSWLFVSRVLWHQDHNVHILNTTMVVLWLIKDTLISLNAQFSKYPNSILAGNHTWLLTTPYSLYHSQVEIILALTEKVLSPRTSSWNLLSSILQLLCSATLEFPWWNYVPKTPGLLYIINVQL